MNIGFDLDGIFVDKPPFIPKRVIEWLYKKHDRALSYRLPSKFEQKIRKFSHKSHFRPPIKNNIKLLQKIKKNTPYQFFLITSRFYFLKEETEKIIKKYRIDKLFHHKVFNNNDTQPHIFKDVALKKHKIHYYIDDDIMMLKYLANKNPNIYFFWLNVKLSKKLSKNLIAIINILEILKMEQ